MRARKKKKKKIDDKKQSLQVHSNFFNFSYIPYDRSRLLRRVSPVSIEKFEVSGTGRIVRVATNAYKPVTYLQSVLTMIKHNQNDSGAGNQFLSLLSLRYLAYLHPLFDIISLSFSLSKYFQPFLLSLEKRKNKECRPFLPSWKLSGMRILISYETRIPFSNWCNVS